MRAKLPWRSLQKLVLLVSSHGDIWQQIELTDKSSVTLNYVLTSLLPQEDDGTLPVAINLGVRF